MGLEFNSILSVLFVILMLITFLHLSLVEGGNKKFFDEEKLLRIDELFLTYKKVHELRHVEQLSSRDLCSKQFILSSIACRDAGNNIGVFLDNLAFAIILNRTIVAHWNEKTNLCFGSVRLQDWIVNTTFLEALRRNAGSNFTLIQMIKAL